ncbi:Heterokaryon incompatibility protein 6 OR allele, partial [Lachnellula suecica]
LAISLDGASKFGLKKDSTSDTLRMTPVYYHVNGRKSLGIKRLPRLLDSPEEMPVSLFYKDLKTDDSIRLILIHPPSNSQSADDIHCTLQHATLSSFKDDITLHYSALSYVWGDEDHQAKIHIDGEEISITVNLFQALRSIRHASKDVLLWVDAVCINQQNIPERNRQVHSMGSIFAGAQNTLIYLGEPDEKSDQVIQSLKNAGTDLEQVPDDYTLREHVASSILSRPWFRRVWVLQELILSRNPIICIGQSQVKWTKLASFLYSFTPVQYDAYDKHIYDGYGPKITQFGQYGDDFEVPEAEMCFMSMSHFRQQVQVRQIKWQYTDGESENERSFLEIIRSRSGLGAKDARDFIFAHAGIVAHSYDDEQGIDFLRNSRDTAETRRNEEFYARQGAEVRALVDISDEERSKRLDRIAACCGGSEGRSRSRLAHRGFVDYSLTAAELYNKYAQLIIQTSWRHSDLTTHIQETHPQEQMSGLASWAPDPSSPFFIEDSPSPAFGTIGRTLASITTLSRVIDPLDPATPSEEAAEKYINSDAFAQTERAQNVKPDEWEGEVYGEIYKAWCAYLGGDILPPLHTILKGETQKEKEKEKEEAYWRQNPLLFKTRSSSPDLEDNNADEDIRKARVAWAMSHSNKHPWESFGGEVYLSDHLVRASTHPHKSIVSYRRVAILSDGTRALVPDASKEGDLICAIRFTSSVVALRPEPFRDHGNHENDAKRDDRLERELKERIA